MSSTASSSHVPPPKSSPSSKQPTDDQIQESTHLIRTRLRELRLDDMASLAQQQQLEFGNPIIDEQVSWVRLSITNLFHFFGYLTATWGSIIVNIFNTNLDIGDRFSTFTFAAGASVILLVIYLWCLISTNPVLVWLYRLTVGRGSGGLGLVNSMNPNLFKNMTQAQAEAAKEKLSAPPKDDADFHSREFSLDIAKMLLQISSLMYERDNKDTVKAVKQIQSQLAQADRVTRGLASIPLGLAGSVIGDRPDRPGRLFSSLLGGKNISSIADQVLSIEHKSRDAIDLWADKYGMCFEPISELASLSQAYVSVFWDPTSTWIAVAFKGTDPRSFEEWTTDFTATFANAQEDITGFNMVHRGFKERMFPSAHISSQRKPWTSISAAVKVVAEGLTKYRDPDTKINV
ncbi:hypothetical protein FRB90_008651, partial [Tulasnella sp. 427]